MNRAFIRATTLGPKQNFLEEIWEKADCSVFNKAFREMELINKRK